MSDTDALPINTVLPELRSALERPGAVVLAARAPWFGKDYPGAAAAARQALAHGVDPDA
ncbi:MAG: hypothetical protein AB2811_04145 [Candidatus Sedimenticola endophacoides]